MSIVKADPDDLGGPALLEVSVVHPRDVAGADEGGADRLFVVAEVGSGGFSPEPATVSSVCKETEVPVRVMLRLNDGLSTTGGELSRLVGLGEDYLSMGAEGLSFGFLTDDLEIDVEVCSHLADRLPGVPWTFHRAIDSALSTDRAWRRVAGLPGLDAVLSAGSVRGLDSGCDELIDRAATDPSVARLLMAGGGLRGEHVPWLTRAGVRRFQVGSAVRPGASWSKSYVDAAHVRSWRMLLDDAVARAEAALQAAAGARE
ncbi:MAG TPA: copper homeostasis protein CutC [Nocardioidaceae bacterium]|nr:copper homeostasis protein CutC [Nocardioidaceae bacterium]